jgi:hypothetical protein
MIGYLVPGRDTMSSMDFGPVNCPDCDAQGITSLDDSRVDLLEGVLAVFGEEPMDGGR